jgi:hypothetical protein
VTRISETSHATSATSPLLPNTASGISFAHEKCADTGSAARLGTVRCGWSGPYVVDFVCFDEKLIIELDGPQHLNPEAIEHDERRTNWLAAQGFHTIRFRNLKLDDNIHAVVDAIGRALEELAVSKNPPSPALPAEGRGPNQRIG